MNQLIAEEKKRANINVLPTFNPMFEVVKTTDGCFRLQKNSTYAKIFSDTPSWFIQIIENEINPLLTSNGTSCPNETVAKMVFFFNFYDAKFNEHEWISFKQIFRFQLIELHFFAVGINFVDQLTSMEITTNYIFKNGVNQLQNLKSVLTNLYQKLRTILIRMGYQRTFGRSFLLFEVHININAKTFI